MNETTEAHPVSQAEVDQQEWENPDNWSHPVFGVYFSKRDSRVWVPKQTPGFGWTINLGHPGGFWWLIGLILIPWLVAARIGGRNR